MQHSSRLPRFLVALALASVLAAVTGAGADGHCTKLGEMMRAIAGARDAGLTRTEAYEAIADATTDTVMRTVARAAVDAAYDCTTCSADMLEGTILGYCEATRDESTPAARDGSTIRL